MRPLVLCAHGTADPSGQQTVLDIAAQVRAELPGTTVEPAYVDVQEPTLESVVAHLHSAGEPPLIVPLLLSGGYHVQVDIARVVEAYAGTTATVSLGPAALLAEVLVSRLLEAGANAEDEVVLAAAGSTRPEAARDAEDMLRLLQERWAGPVALAYGSAAQPDVPTAVAAAKANDRGRVAVAAYLLGHGHFHHVLKAAGADLVTEPLGADPRVVAQVIARATP